MDIKVGVKYCGGCNPNYDRKEIAFIIERLSGMKLVPYKETEIPDITLVLCGCSSDCMNIDEYKSMYETIYINSPEQIEEVIECIRAVNRKIIKSEK
jgi:4-hydroxybutyrate CoA-transferase